MNQNKRPNLLITLFDLRIGGISNFILQTVPTLKSRINIEVIFFGPNNSMLEPFQAAEIKTHRIRYDGIKDIFKASKELSKFIKENKMDVVSTHLTIDKLITTIARKYSDFKIISTFHSVNDPYTSREIKYLITSKFEDYFHNKVVDKNLAVSKAALSSWNNYRGLRNKNSKVIYSGIEELNCPRISNESKYSSKKIFVTACRFTEEKGLDRLIEYFSIVNQNNSSWEFWILGAGLLETELREKVRSLDLEYQILFKGFQTNLCPFYIHADFFINSSYHEALPISILEAMSLGIPVVGSNVGGIPEIIDQDENGYLVDFNNMEESVAILKKCIAMNKVKQQQLSDNSREKFLSHFSISTYVNKFEEEIQSLF